MKRVLLNPARLGVAVLLVFAAAAAGPEAASATEITGTATGKTSPRGKGVFRISGAYKDPSTDEAGTYAGTYVEDTTGYTSCPLTGTYEVYCDHEVNPAAFRCNLIHGEVTFKSRGRTLTLLIGTEFPLGHAISAVCLDSTNPQIHNVNLELFNGTPALFSRGYGDLMYAYGTVFGTSTPRGRAAYEDSFRLSIDMASS
jgi:hypothetical protein